MDVVLDSYKVQVSLLEEKLKQQKDQMEVGFLKKMKEKKYFHSIEVNNMKNMRAQEVVNLKVKN